MSGGLASSLVPPVVFGAATLLRLPVPGRRGTSAGTCLALAFFTLGLTVNVDPVYIGLDAATGVPNLADLVEHTAVIAGATVLLGVLRAVHVPGRPRFPLVLVVAAVAVTAVSAALFAVAPLPVEAPQFTERYAGVPAIRGYWAVQVVFLGFALVELIRIAGYARTARRTATRVGFAFVAAGAATGLVYAVNKLAALAAAGLDPGGPVAVVTGLFDEPLLALGTVAIGAGLLLPPAAAATRRAWEPVLYRWDVQLLRGLWLDLAVVNPRLVLTEVPTRAEDLLDGYSLAIRRYRMVVELLDATAALRNYVTPQLDRAALDAGAGLGGPRRAAVVDACWLTAARTRYLRGAAPGSGRAGPLSDTRSGEDEVARHLRRVAWSRRHSRRVARFVRDLPGHLAGETTPAPPASGEQPRPASPVRSAVGGRSPRESNR